MENMGKMENKADKGKHKIKQSEEKQEKNVRKLYIGNRC